MQTARFSRALSVGFAAQKRRVETANVLFLVFGTAPFRTAIGQKHLTLSVFWPLTRWPDPGREIGRYGGGGGGGGGEEGEERGGGERGRRGRGRRVGV